MKTTLAPGGSLRQVAAIVRNATLFGTGAWTADALREEHPDARRLKRLLPTDRDVLDLFALLDTRRLPYLLVGGIALLRYVEGRNTEDIDLLMSLPSLQQVPEILVETRTEYFARGRFRSVRVDVLLTSNALFAELQRSHGAIHSFAEQEVPTATPEGLILLKLYALPSLYRQGQFDHIAVYESDIASLVHRHRPNLVGLLEALQPHLESGDLHELRGIVKDIENRIARFEQRRRDK